MLKSLLISALSGLVLLSNANALDLSGTVFEQVGQEKNIDPHLLYAVALAESAYSPVKNARGAAPYSWTLRLPNKPIYATSKMHAKEELFGILKYTSSVDVGLMQINWRWHKHRVKRPEDLLDPLTNVRIGADILLENFRRSPTDLVAAGPLPFAQCQETESVWPDCLLYLQTIEGLPSKGFSLTISVRTTCVRQTFHKFLCPCLLYTSDAADDTLQV